MKESIEIFKAWMASKQGLSVVKAVEYAEETMTFLIGKDIPAENEEFFFALLESLIVSEFNHAPSITVPNGGPVTTPKQAVDLAMDWLNSLKMAQGFFNADVKLEGTSSEN